MVGFESYDVNIQQVFTNTLPSGAVFSFFFIVKFLFVLLLLVLIINYYYFSFFL